MKPTLLIACGALAKEVGWLIDVNGWTHMEVTCLPAKLHNRPEKIPDLMRQKIQTAKASEKYQKILAVYADCGTGGLLDNVLVEEGVERIAGPHCYAFYSGLGKFEKQQEDDISTFYLTDYLTRFFDRLIIEGLGLDRYPQLLSDYFGHYTKLVYLAQIEDTRLVAKAEAAAERLGLTFEMRKTGMGDLARFLEEKAA